MTNRIADQNAGAVHFSFEVINQSAEAYWPLGIGSLILTGLVNDDFTAKLEGVLTVDNRDMVQELENAVWPNNFWPSDSDSSVETGAVGANSGYSVVQGVGSATDTRGNFVVIPIKC